MKTQRIILIVALILVAIMAGFGWWQNFGPVGPAGYGRWTMGPGHMMGGGFGLGMGGIMGPVFWIFVLVVLVLAVNWIAGMIRQAEGSGNGSRDAIEILKQRFAKGEIDQAEYEARLKVISD